MTLNVSPEAKDMLALLARGIVPDQMAWAVLRELFREQLASTRSTGRVPPIEAGTT